MSAVTDYPDELQLGRRISGSAPEADQLRQREEFEEVLRRFERQPGVILADEVGMGKTFVALAVAIHLSLRRRNGPAIVMAPSNLMLKWQHDLRTFCELYWPHRTPVDVGHGDHASASAPNALRFATVGDAADMLRMVGAPIDGQPHVMFLSHGAMSRQRRDPWIVLFLVAQALRRHARGGNQQLIQVKRVIHRFLAELLPMKGLENRHRLGNELWSRLIAEDPGTWRKTYNEGIRSDEWKLREDPVPAAVRSCIEHIDLRTLADALRNMPQRARGGEARVKERVEGVGRALWEVNRALWAEVLAKSRWRSPLLVMDEAHHLKNADTMLARQLQSAESIEDMRTGDGAMSGRFERMLFLTATPFQLGHTELVRVLERFEGTRWDASAFGHPDDFRRSLSDLQRSLDESQRHSILLQKAWHLLQPVDLANPGESATDWWYRLEQAHDDALTRRQKTARDAYRAAHDRRADANHRLRPWVIRHNKGEHWPGTGVRRRERIEGGAIKTAAPGRSEGIGVPPDQMLPFFLAAQAAASTGTDLLGEALCSSYEAFRDTRSDQRGGRQHLKYFDEAVSRTTAALHPKMAATVRRAVDLWEQGEKVVIFAFYRRTCAALRRHVSDEMLRRLDAIAGSRIAGRSEHGEPILGDRRLDPLQAKYFDNPKSVAKRTLDAALRSIIDAHAERLHVLGSIEDGRTILESVMRRFLRTEATLLRCFPFELESQATHTEIVMRFLDHRDCSGSTWRDKFHGFLDFLLTRKCSDTERALYLAELQRVSTGAHAAEDEEDEEDDDPESPIATGGRRANILPNVAVCSGATRMDVRARRMRTFNSPFLPDVLVCSEVMAEGVDLQRCCRHVIHHDLAWNPSTIEQRTGRIDRIGCKAQERHPILSFLPYIRGAADERQFRVMRDREQWFQVVMGQDVVEKLITPEVTDSMPPLPPELAAGLAYDLSVVQRP